MIPLTSQDGVSTDNYMKFPKPLTRCRADIHSFICLVQGMHHRPYFTEQETELQSLGDLPKVIS